MSRYRKSLYITLCILFVFAGYISISVFYKYILSYVESKVIPEVAKNAGIDNLRINVRSAGLFGAEIASLRLGKEPGAPSIDSVILDYNPIGLYNKFIKKAVISGVEIECEFTEGKIRITGFDLDCFISNLRDKNRPSADRPKAIPFGSIELRNSVFVLKWKDKKTRFPAELEIIPGVQNRGLIVCRLSLYPRDHELTLNSVVNLDKNESVISINSKGLPLNRFSDFAMLVPGMSLSGETDVSANAGLQFSPFKISSASCVITSSNLGISYNGIKLENPKESKKPFILDIRNNGENEWIFAGSSIYLASPIPVTISTPEARLATKDNSLKFSGNFTINPTSFVYEKVLYYGKEKFFQIRGKYSASLTDKGAWYFNAANIPSSEPLDKTGRNLGGLDISLNALEFEISGKGKGSKGLFQYAASISDISAINDNLSLKTPGLTIGGKAEVVNSEVKGLINLNTRNVVFKSGSSKIDIPAFSVSGIFEQNTGKSLRFDGALNLKDISMEDSKLQFAASGIGGTIPFEWPFKIIEKKGAFFADAVFWKNMNLGAFSGTTRQDNSGLLFDGEYKSAVLKGMVAGFSGKSELFGTKSPDTEISFIVRKYKTGSDIDLGRFFPQTKGMAFGGTLELNGRISFMDKKPAGFLKANIREGSFRYSDKDIVVEGININLSMTDLFAARSGPRQHLSFDRASIGAIQLSEGKVDFQVESAESFYIEKSNVKWCNGSVNTQSIRISPANRDVSLTLFCDRVNLAMIIEQFGIAKAEGSGSVNGKIPVEYKGGKISFTDGFLYSTPGEGGTIHITGAKLLEEGTVPGTSQLTQIDLTLEALKDYIYDWVRLKLTTEGEDLLLYLQFDGRPANPLPFIYKKELGGFVRVKSAEEGSRFQGIRLDINLVVPLDKILHYRDSLNISR
ncbi:MAG: YdbH domain-containing protein [Desulfobacterales bacterium]